MTRRVLGASPGDGATTFGAWAPLARRCAVRLVDRDRNEVAEHPMEPVGEGHWEVTIPWVGPGALYLFVVDDRELPDPYARFLPFGVHGPAEVVCPPHAWQYGSGVHRPLAQHVIYELHVGTFTPEGTFRAAIGHLAELAHLGVTAIELMPVAAFDGTRGWGYDGVAPYAPHATYGTPDDLRRLVDEAHGLGLAVLLDVVYNHYGPSGNYLAAYDPAYFHPTLENAWGAAPDFTHPVMRRHVLDLARHWLEEFRFDGLRLDATHAVLDETQPHVLAELAAEVGTLRPRKLLIAEDERNDPALVREVGLDAVWADDFHHQVQVTLTGERDGYYAGYTPGVADLARVIERGWLYEGQEFPTTGHPRGKPAGDLPASALVYCLQNHDQVGNRARGERLAALVPASSLRAVTMLLLFLPMTPLLFMGQEWAASTPFLYFTDHEEELGGKIKVGRHDEFRHFEAFRDEGVRATIPDPQAPSSFEVSRLRWEEREQGRHAAMLELVQGALALRRADPVLRDPARERLHAEAHGEVLVVRRTLGSATRWLVISFGEAVVDVRALGLPTSQATCLLASDSLPEPHLLPPRGAVVLAVD